jgi:hypothetical protein
MSEITSTGLQRARGELQIARYIHRADKCLLRSMDGRIINKDKALKAVEASRKQLIAAMCRVTALVNTRVRTCCMDAKPRSYRPPLSLDAPCECGLRKRMHCSCRSLS